MKKGNWFFVYRHTYTKMEDGNEVVSTVEDIKIPLSAVTETEAVKEAKKQWKPMREKADVTWVKRHAWSLLHPPGKVIDDGPTLPRVIYVIDL